MFWKEHPRSCTQQFWVVTIGACDTQHLDYTMAWSWGELSPSWTYHKIKTEHICVTCPLVTALSQTVCDVDGSPAMISVGDVGCLWRVRMHMWRVHMHASHAVPTSGWWYNIGQHDNWCFSHQIRDKFSSLPSWYNISRVPVCVGVHRQSFVCIIDRGVLFHEPGELPCQP